MTFKDIFPGLSRKWNFKKIQDFPGGVGTLDKEVRIKSSFKEVFSACD